MSKLIMVVGNSGVGKTTLARLLAAQGNFVTGLEEHGERPFQRLMRQDPARYGLANQLDYLLLRAEQERMIRQSPLPGLQDGGLEMDYFVFNRRFYQLGYLTSAEFELCTRFYHFIRSQLPLPELIIYLTAPVETIAQRFAQRSRSLEIARLEDLVALQGLLDEWLAQVTTIPIVRVDSARGDATYDAVLPDLLRRISNT